MKNLSLLKTVLDNEIGLYDLKDFYGRISIPTGRERILINVEVWNGTLTKSVKFSETQVDPLLFYNRSADRNGLSTNGTSFVIHLTHIASEAQAEATATFARSTAEDDFNRDTATVVKEFKESLSKRIHRLN